MHRTLKKQIGWTLPFMWIFLVGIGSAIFFFGWWTLLYIIAGAVMITAATFIYDLFGYGTRDHSGQARIWFSSEADLSELGDLICREFGFQLVEHDSAKVWEWIEAKSRFGRTRLNISRKPRDYSFPVRISLSYVGFDPRKAEEQMADRLSRLLATDVVVGDVEYLQGNDYDFKTERTFRFERH